MKIERVKITNFKSIYGTQEFNFKELNGLIKLSGNIGSGKTALCEALQWGLLGTVRGQNNPDLISWNTDYCEIELEMMSKNKHIHIIRNSSKPLIVEVEGSAVAASNKRNMQLILEEDLYDIPKIAITKMCLITFNGFASLADMNPSDTKQFLDDIFGFKLFTEYNEEILNEKKNNQNNSIKLSAMYEDAMEQVNKLKEKKEEQKKEIESNIDIENLTKQRSKYVDEGTTLKEEYNNINNEYKEKIDVINNEKLDINHKKLEFITLGKQEKSWYNTFKNGVCPTCGQNIDDSVIKEHYDLMLEYGDKVKEYSAQEAEKENIIKSIEEERDNKLKDKLNLMEEIKNKILTIDNDIKMYNNNIQLITENYDALISEYDKKIKEMKEELDKCDQEIIDWNEMSELFTKTLRHKLLNILIPHINTSIQYYINKLEQPYRVEFDREFKCHIYLEAYGKEINYANLSTGQKKNVDLAIVFGILQNMISNVDMNVIVLDELFSNMDSDTRNIMLSVLKESLATDKSIFIINHAEMGDDYFNHKIRVTLRNKNISSVKKRAVNNYTVLASKYEKIF